MNPFSAILDQIADLRIAQRAQPAHEWGIVTAIDPLRVRLGISAAPLPYAPVALSPVHVGQTVQTMKRRGEWVVLGPITQPGSAPFAYSAETATITGTGASSASAPVTFPVGRFTVPPIPVLGNGLIAFSAAFQDVTADGMDVFVRRLDGANFTSTVTVYWAAVQMTPISAGG